MLQEIAAWGRWAKLTTARKPHYCKECRVQIQQGEQYYSIAFNCAGLTANIHPDRVCVKCIQNYMADAQERWVERERWSKFPLTAPKEWLAIKYDSYEEKLIAERV